MVVSRRFQMKFLKIALIVLLPAMGIVGCKKSGTKPECSSHKSKQAENTEDVGSKFGDIAAEEGTSVTLVGSGDDDSNGGDKRPKKSR